MRHPILLILLICITCTTLANTNNDRIPGNRDAYLKNKIAAGWGHTLEIRNGTLWAWGWNTTGQLGDSTNTNRKTAVQIGTADDWIAVAAGESHSLGIKADGSLWSWGHNLYGQLGHGNTTYRNTPVRIGSANSWVAIAAGFHFSLALKADGTLWAWGVNTHGQLGDGSSITRYAPIQIGASRDWVSITAGGSQCLAIKVGGTLWAWGNNNYGQLGDGTNITRYTPVQVGSANKWIEIAAGGQHSIGLKADGTLWAWGENSDGQLGDSTNIDRRSPVQIDTTKNWTSLATGAFHSLATKANGTLWAWGRNSSGQLGNIANTNKTTPVHIDTANKWKSIFGGYYHSLGIKANGMLCAWGSNSSGQLGDSTMTSSTSPVQIGTGNEWMSVVAGAYFNLGVKADGTLWAWGDNGWGQLGDSSTIDRTRPQQIGSADDWVSITAGGFHSLGIKADGTLWAWGWNGFGQLGVSNIVYTHQKKPVQVGSANDWVSIVAGAYHTLAIKSDGTLWAWGNNTYGQLGDSAYNNRNSPVQVGTANDWVSIGAGGYHSHAIKADGTLWAWGYNNFGELGIGSSIFPNTPVQVGSAASWVSIAGDHNHTMGLKADGTLWTWGRNSYGELGDGTTTQRNSPVQIAAAYDWISIAAGAGNGIGIKSDGTLWAWGNNDFGEIGDGTLTQRNNPVKIGSADNWVGADGGTYHSSGIKADRQTICATGRNTDGQIGDGSTTNRNTFYCSCTPGNIYTMPGNQILCAATNTYFRIKAKYTTAYKWQVNTGSGWTTVTNNTVYSGANTDSLILTNLNATYNNYWYRCIAYNYCNDPAISDSAKLALSSATVVTSHPSDSLICSGTNATFYINTTGTTVNYQWQVYNGISWSNISNTGMYSGATTGILLLTTVPTAVNGYKYRCIISNLCMQADTSFAATLTVDSTSMTSVSINGDTVMCVGQTTGSFTAIPVNGGINPAYQWQVNGVNTGTNSPNFTTASLLNGDVVRSYMTSSALCATPKISMSNALSVQVIQNVTPAIAITSDAGTSWCSGKENIFRSANTNGGNTPVFQWKINGTNIGPGADTLWVPYLNHGDVIECGMTSSHKCPVPKTVNSNKINMTIIPTTKSSAVIMPNPDSVVCKDKEVTMYCAFTNGGTTPKFQWMLNGTDMPGEKNGTLKTTALKDGDVINCRFISNAVCVFPEVSNPISFDVHPILNPEVSITVIYAGDNKHLFTALAVDGGINPTYLWYLNGKLLKDEHSSSITLTGLVRTDKVWVEMASSEDCIPENLRLVSSKIITTGVGATGTAFNTLSLYPNPNTGTFIIEGNLTMTSVPEINVTILNSIGQVIYEEKVQLSTGKLHHTIDTGKELVSGSYLLRLNYNGEQDFKQFVIMK